MCDRRAVDRDRLAADRTPGGALLGVSSPSRTLSELQNLTLVQAPKPRATLAVSGSLAVFLFGSLAGSLFGCLCLTGSH